MLNVMEELHVGEMGFNTADYIHGPVAMSPRSPNAIEVCQIQHL
eukprot:SAG11_NODE_13_length_26388_cov_67.360341_24_plen_44_part_00